MNIVYVPCKDKDEAEEIARSIVKEKLSFCVNIIPRVTSIYRWQGKVEESQESVLIVKTKSALLDKLIKMIEKLHSYDTPDIVAWRIEKTSKAVEQWVKSEL